MTPKSLLGHSRQANFKFRPPIRQPTEALRRSIFNFSYPFWRICLSPPSADGLGVIKPLNEISPS